MAFPGSGTDRIIRSQFLFIKFKEINGLWRSHDQIIKSIMLLFIDQMDLVIFNLPDLFFQYFIQEYMILIASIDLPVFGIPLFRS